MQSLVDMVHDLTGELDLPVLLKTIVQHACQICGARGAALYLLHKHEDGLELKVKHGETGPIANPGKDDPETQAAKPRKNASGVEVFDAVDLPNGVCQPMLPMGDSKAEAMVGVISVMNKEKGSFFTEEDCSLLEIYCQQAAVSVVNVQQYNIARHSRSSKKNWRGLPPRRPPSWWTRRVRLPLP